MTEKKSENPPADLGHRLKGTKENAPAGKTEAVKENKLSDQSLPQQGKLCTPNPIETLIAALKPITDRVRKDVTAIRGAHGSSWTKDGLTSARMEKHLKGGPARGCCPIKEGESTTRLGLFDLDSHKGETSWDDMIDVAAKLCSTLDERGLRGIPFRSTGGSGMHIYLLWDDPQDAYSVRTAMREVLVSIGYTDGTGGVKNHQIEVFPKQDRVEEGKFGNMFILPLAGKSEPLGGLTGFESMGRDYVLDMEWPMSDPVPVLEKPVREVVVAESVDLNTLRSALDVIVDSGKYAEDCPHDLWRNMMFSIHHGTGGSDEGRELALEFSKRLPKFEQTAFDKCWDHTRERDDGITVQTVLYMAREAGWVEDVSGQFDVVVAPPDDPPALPRFARDKNGRIEATDTNIDKALRFSHVCGVELRHDIFRDEIMIAPPGTNEWRSFKDTDYKSLSIHLEGKGFKTIQKERLRDGVAKVADDNRFDSAVLWLTSLEWDGVQRVETFIPKYFGAKDTEYTRAIGFYLWTALAGRVLRPGVKADMVPVAHGIQGSKKSSTVASIAPFSECFMELDLSLDTANLARLMRGKIIAELGELRGMRKADREVLKSFITRTQDEWVPKFKEFPRQYPRRCVLFGTTNQQEFLTDETGHRRWLPFDSGECDPVGVVAIRNQLWAEGRELFIENGIMFKDAETLAEKFHQDYVDRDPWEDMVQTWLNVQDEPFVTSEKMLTFAVGMSGSQMNQANKNRMAGVLKTLGFKRRKIRHEGKEVRVYVRD